MSLISIAQMNSQDNIEQNLADVKQLIIDAKQQDAQLLVLPENFACFAPGKQRDTAERFEEIQQQLEQWAANHQIWLIAGTLPCPFRPNGDRVPDLRVRTTSLCISPEGTVARYDKIHLFDVAVGDNIGTYQESLNFEPGDDLVVASTPFGQIGLMVCYDLRFPELAIKLRSQGADLLTAPAAFTYQTGQAHWELLLRARAIDTQCHVLGAAQQGWHGGDRQTWGHASIVNSRGTVLNHAHRDGLQLITAHFDQHDQEQHRTMMPLMQHRRLS